MYKICHFQSSVDETWAQEARKEKIITVLETRQKNTAIAGEVDGEEQEGGRADQEEEWEYYKVDVPNASRNLNGPKQDQIKDFVAAEQSWWTNVQRVHKYLKKIEERNDPREISKLQKWSTSGMPIGSLPEDLRNKKDRAPKPKKKPTKSKDAGKSKEPEKPKEAPTEVMRGADGWATIWQQLWKVGFASNLD